MEAKLNPIFNELKDINKGMEAIKTTIDQNSAMAQEALEAATNAAEKATDAANAAIENSNEVREIKLSVSSIESRLTTIEKTQDEAISNIDAKDEAVKSLEEKLDSKINEDKQLRKEVEELKATLENIARTGAERMSKAESDDQPEEKELKKYLQSHYYKRYG